MKSPNSLKFSAVKEAFADLVKFQAGNPDLVIHNINSPEMAGTGDLVFAPDSDSLGIAFERGVRAFVVSAKLKEAVEKSWPGASYYFVSNVQLAFALASKKYFPDLPSKYHHGPDIHPTAVIDSTAQLEPGVKIGAHTAVGPLSKIASGVYIGPNCTLEGEVTIGEGTQIHGNVFVSRRTEIGRFCDIKPGSVLGAGGYGYAHNEKGEHTHIQQLGRLVLEDFVDVGSNCAIDRATFGETRIGQGTKLDNLIHIAHNVKIGKHCLLTGGFMSAGSATIGNHVMSGGRTSVTDHVKICDNVQLGGLSAVGKDITKPGPYAGYPLLPLKEHLKATASIAVLPKIRRDLARVMKQLGLTSEEE